MQTERLKKEINKNFGKIALERNASDACCSSAQKICCNDINDISKQRISSIIGYNAIELKSIPEESIIGLGCDGTSLCFADCQYNS